MAVTGLLAQARRAIEERSWLEAREAYARADRSDPLQAEDLGLWATAQLMLAQDEAAIGTLERAHYRYLERGETVKLSSFGSFVVRKKGQRIGRNFKTAKEVPISPRRVMVFKPSAILKQRINSDSK